MMLAAYSDESEDSRCFAVSGLLGTLPNWVELGRLWESKLKEFDLSEFHASKCEERLRPFERYEREVRDMFQREFYALIGRVEVWGFCTAVWRSAYKLRWKEFESARSGTAGNFTHPYFLAFQHSIEAMCLAVERGGFKRSEPIAFVFDQQKELEGRAKVLYDSIKYHPGSNIVYSHRLGSISFESRFAHVQLQAADVWAYESRKHVSNVLIDHRQDAERWQYRLLCESGRNVIYGFPDESLDQLISIMHSASKRESD
jgi:hypothetical protein